MKEFLLKYNDEFLKIKAQKIKGKLWYHVNGQTHCYDPLQKTNSNTNKSSSAESFQITAPMPGKIIKILKKEGDMAAPGETLVVMEAMKMEYNLKARKNTVIHKILCQESQTVELGECLIKMKDPKNTK